MRAALAPLLAVPLLFAAACSEEIPDVEVPSLENVSEGVLEGADGITKVLAEQYQLTDVGEVDCPPQLDFSQGATVECTVVVAGQEKTVEVGVSSSGELTVSEPK